MEQFGVCIAKGEKWENIRSVKFGGCSRVNVFMKCVKKADHSRDRTLLKIPPSFPFRDVYFCLLPVPFD